MEILQSIRSGVDSKGWERLKNGLWRNPNRQRLIYVWCTICKGPINPNTGLGYNSEHSCGKDARVFECEYDEWGASRSKRFFKRHVSRLCRKYWESYPEENRYRKKLLQNLHGIFIKMAYKKLTNALESNNERNRYPSKLKSIDMG